MPSSVIRSFAYDQSERRLTVRFVNGRVYRYDDLPPDVADELTRAPSQGQFFNRVIRDRFRFTRERRTARD